MGFQREQCSNIYNELINWRLENLTVGDVTQGVFSVNVMTERDLSIWDETSQHMQELLESWLSHECPDLNRDERALFIAMVYGGWHQTLEELADAIRVLG